MNGEISFEQYLKDHDKLIYSNVGVSMLPLLRQNKDLFILRKKGTKRCRAGDVVLYRRLSKKPVSGGNASKIQYVLHRVVEVRPDDYVILGDNCTAREYGIRDEDIIGVMTGFIRNGKEHSISEAGYRFYSFLWMHTAGVRIAMKKTAIRVRRSIKK